jgi:hypothetical protein
MSPVSRGRKGKKKPKKSGSERVIFGAPEPCDCLACTGDLGGLLDDMLAAADDMVDCDALDAELFGAGVMALGAGAEQDFALVLVEGLIPAIEARSGAAAVALLNCLGSVAGPPVADAARAALDRLVDGGSPLPGWANESAAPVAVAECLKLSNDEVTVLAGTFERADRSHTILVTVDHFECGEASDIFLAEPDQVPELLAAIESEGMGTTRERIDPAEFRWLVEAALDARAVHDDEDDWPEAPEDEDGFDYPLMAVLTRTRMNILPLSDKPKPEHGFDEPLIDLPRVLPGRRQPKELPPRRAAGPARVYQIKVGLKGAKPPIWRRLEVAADLSLAELHDVIQVAFPWDDSHLHVFETPYGDFGRPDSELGHRSAQSVNLDQVTGRVGSKISYSYDFGDCWDHDIVVEKIFNRDETVSLPRCTGGRRAAPPEDCGGMWGYAYLMEILADPAHEEHEERLEWLGLDTADEFDPAAFSAAEISEALAQAFR